MKFSCLNACLSPFEYSSRVQESFADAVISKVSVTLPPAPIISRFL